MRNYSCASGNVPNDCVSFVRPSLGYASSFLREIFEVTQMSNINWLNLNRFYFHTCIYFNIILYFTVPINLYGVKPQRKQKKSDEKKMSNENLKNTLKTKIKYDLSQMNNPIRCVNFLQMDSERLFFYHLFFPFVLLNIQQVFRCNSIMSRKNHNH